MPFLGIALNGGAGLINLAWALVLIRSGRAWKSPALVAGGKHVMTDVWTTGAVLVGFALVPITGWLRLAPLVAALVALNILWADYGMVRESVGGLMDEVSDPDAVAELRRTISEHAAGAIEAHDVRTRTAGNVTFVEFHLVVPGRMVVEDAHVICDRIEHALRERIGDGLRSRTDDRQVETVKVPPAKPVECGWRGPRWTEVVPIFRRSRAQLHGGAWTPKLRPHRLASNGVGAITFALHIHATR